jgi:hypothetical protein
MSSLRAQIQQMSPYSLTAIVTVVHRFAASAATLQEGAVELLALALQSARRNLSPLFAPAARRTPHPACAR